MYVVHINRNQVKGLPHMGQIDFRCLTIKADQGKRVQDQETGDYRREYFVSITSDATGARRGFRFTDSAWNEKEGRVGLSGDDLLWAFRCFVSDAQAGTAAFSEFCGDFAYDEDSRRAHGIWQACRAAADKYRGLWSANYVPAWDMDGHMNGVLEELSSMGVE